MILTLYDWHVPRCSGALRAPVADARRCSGALRAPVADARRCSGALRAPVADARRCSGALRAPVAHARRCSGALRAPVAHARRCSGALRAPVADARRCSSALRAPVADARRCSGALRAPVADARRCSSGSASAGGKSQVQRLATVIDRRYNSLHRHQPQFFSPTIYSPHENTRHSNVFISAVRVLPGNQGPAGVDALAASSQGGASVFLGNGCGDSALRPGRDHQ